MAATKVSPHIRWMIRRDMPEIEQIEIGVENPIPIFEIEQFCQSRYCIGMVAELGEKVVGFVLYELHKSHLQISRIAVHPEYRRLGIASAIIGKLKSQLSIERRRKLEITVCEYDLYLQLFLRSQSFLCVEVVRCECADDLLFAYKMQ